MIDNSLHRFDQVGFVAAFTCIIHCLLVALAPAILAATGLGPLLEHEAEWGFTLVAVFVAVLAAAIGLRNHGSWQAATLLFGGTLFLLVSRFTETLGFHHLGTFIGVAGGIGIMGGHALNLRLLRGRGGRNS